MRLLMIAALAAYGCAAQTPKLNVPVFTGTQPCLLVYVPSGTPAGTLTPKCLPLGVGLNTAGGTVNAPPVVVPPTSNLVSHVERFPLAGLGPWPTDGSDKTVVLNVAVPPIPGSAIMLYTTVPGYQVFSVATAPAVTTAVAVVVAQSVYAAPDGVDIVVTYLAAS